MGAAAALIPGIVGIAGGQYQQMKERDKQAAQDQRMMAGARQLATGGAGNARNPITGQVEPGMADERSILGTMAGFDPRIANALVSSRIEQLGKPKAIPKRVNLINPTTNKTWSGPEADAAAFGPEWLETGSYAPPPKEPTTELSKYITEYNSLSPNDPNRIIYKQKIENLGLPSGMTFESDGKGGFVLTQGGGGRKGGGGFLTPKVESDIQTDYFLTQKGLDQLSGIRASYKPEYQQILPRLQNWKTGLKSMAGLDVSDDERNAARSFAEYRQRSASFTNDKIRELTGTAMGKDEAPRYMLQIPAAGSGLFDGDSPIDYEAKLDESYKAIENAQFRLAYAMHLNSVGTPMSKEQMFAIPLDQMKSKMQEVGVQAAKEFKAKYPAATEDEVKSYATNKVTQIFGRK